jgi:threonylcarbamoyladenosine tRNA methylthiotransferase MtaB
MPHLHLPAQSGSDAVLKRMARRNRVADFEALAAAARARIPGLTITTDLIVGFPGETESDFEETVDFATRMRFAHMHVFPYSARQGTAAARFGAQTPEPERKRRVRRLVELDAEMGRSVRESFVGQKRPVLWESLVEPNGRGPVWSGLTDNYLRVEASTPTGAPAGADLRNVISEVQLTGQAGEHLTGVIL